MLPHNYAIGDCAIGRNTSLENTIYPTLALLHPCGVKYFFDSFYCSGAASPKLLHACKSNPAETIRKCFSF